MSVLTMINHLTARHADLLYKQLWPKLYLIPAALIAFAVFRHDFDQSYVSVLFVFMVTVMTSGAALGGIGLAAMRYDRYDGIFSITAIGGGLCMHGLAMMAMFYLFKGLPHFNQVGVLVLLLSPLAAGYAFLCYRYQAVPEEVTRGAVLVVPLDQYRAKGTVS